MSNIALRLNGPAIVTYRGVTFYSKGDVALTSENESFDVTTDRFGVIEPRSLNKNLQLSFIPDGRYAGFFGILYPHASAIPGQLTTRVRSFLPAAVTIGTEVINIPSHNYTAGDAIRGYNLGGALPAGLTAGTRYFVGPTDANNIKLYATRANAIAGTSPIDLTGTGTGEHRFIDQEQLTVLSSDGRQYVFDVAAIATMPSLNAKSNDTLFGAVTFDIFRGAGVDATTAGSLFTLTTGNSFAEPGLDPSLILTQSYVFTWGSSPWTALETIDGFKWDFPMATEDVVDDKGGRIGRRITNLGCNVACQPIGITETDLTTALLLQGSGAQRGARLGGVTDFVMTGTGVSVTGKGMALMSGPQSFGRSTERIGTLSWRASRMFNAGVPYPMFIVA